MTRDPLADTLFRGTTAAAAAEVASAAPVRTAGTRTRAGNAMVRTRAALLDGARRSVEVSGTKITMAQLAAAAGVAKATLYNHFRTRDAVLSALLEDEVQRLAAEAGGRPLAEGLVLVANRLAEHPLLRSLARLEPGTLTALACVDLGAPGWQAARSAVAGALAADRRSGADLVLRWLSSFVVTPAPRAEIAADVAVLMAGLPVGRTVTDELIPTNRTALPA
ncbi:MAG: TetR/AcrR family transcriptional regulator [Pseudonocardiales bacterium]|jgi:AcrR family transcriptional regulator|nr:TetR/AcrR family transcriptional regulator [Pseudonocardiales bacterium]